MLRNSTPTTAVLAIALATSAALFADDPSWQLERVEQSFAVTDQMRVRVYNPLGNLAVRAHDKPEVYLLANWQHHADDPRILEIDADESSRELSIEVRFAGAIGSDSEPDAWSKRRADLTVFVPASTATSFSTDSGKLEVRGTRARTDVRTVTGDIKLRIFGSAHAVTEHGNVLTQLRSASWKPPVVVRSKTGTIRVELPRGCEMNATAATRGEVTSDFSMEVERVDGSELKRFRLTSGDASSTEGVLELSSYSGPIQVVETLVAAEKDGDEDD